MIFEETEWFKEFELSPREPDQRGMYILVKRGEHNMEYRVVGNQPKYIALKGGIYLEPVLKLNIKKKNQEDYIVLPNDEVVYNKKLWLAWYYAYLLKPYTQGKIEEIDTGYSELFARLIKESRELVG